MSCHSGEVTDTLNHPNLPKGYKASLAMNKDTSRAFEACALMRNVVLQELASF